MFNLVQQEHHFGCFIAALAMITGKTYRQAFKLVHPGKKIPKNHNLYEDYVNPKPYSYNDPKVAIHPLDAMKKLEELGYHTWYGKKIPFNKIKNNALLCIKWSYSNMGHALVFDASKKSFLDPARENPWELSFYESQLCFILYFEKKLGKKAA